MKWRISNWFSPGVDFTGPPTFSKPEYELEREEESPVAMISTGCDTERLNGLLYKIWSDAFSPDFHSTSLINLKEDK